MINVNVSESKKDYSPVAESMAYICYTVRNFTKISNDSEPLASFCLNKCPEKDLRDMVRNILLCSRNQTKAIPKFYYHVAVGTIVIGLIGIVFLFMDLFLSITNLSLTVYILWVLCSVSLFLTNYIAMREWKFANDKGSKEKTKKRQQ